MRTLCWVFVILAISAGSAFGQVSGDYRSTQTGDWNNIGIWERFNGSAWISATAYPVSSDGTITIRTGHVVTIPNGLTVIANQIVVNEDLIVASGGQLNLADGTGVDLSLPTAASLADISGILTRGNLTTIDDQSTAARLQFRAGSEYRHNYTTTFGDLPMATWNASSTISLIGFANKATITADASWAQTIGNLVHNSPLQAAIIDLNGTLKNIQGNLSVLSSGSNVLQFGNSQSLTIDIAGNVVISGTARLNFSTSGNPVTVNVGGNLTHTSTNSTGSSLTLTGTATLNLAGDFLMNSGTGRLHLANAGTTGSGTLNLSGNFSVVSGILDEAGSSPTSGHLRFVKAGTQVFVNTGTITGFINYYISAATTLNAGTSPLSATSPGSFTLDGTVMVGSTDNLGAIQISYTRGNIRTNTRTYNTGSRVIYSGAATQYMGAGQPQVAGVTTVINNASDVLLIANTTINGTLRVENGSLDLNNFALTSGGTFESAGGSLKSTATSSLIIQGTTGGNWGTMTFAPSANTIGILTLNRTGTNAAASLNSTLNVQSQLNLTRGDLVNTSGLTMIPGAMITRYNTGTLSGNYPLVTGGFFDLTYRTFSVSGGPYATFNTSLELPIATNVLGNLVVSTAQNQDIVTLAHNIYLNGTLTLSRGFLAAGTSTITLQGTASWLDNTGNFTADTGTVTFGGSTTVGGTSSTVFNNLSITSAHSATFTRSFNVNGNINLTSGSTLDMGANTLTLSGATNQTISANGATFSNITVGKTGGNVQVTSLLNMTGLLQFGTTTTNCTVTSGGFINLISTSDAANTGNAMIYRLASGNTISGNVTVQRFMNGEGRIYRYISSPVSGAMVSQWKDDFDITGTFNDPSPRKKICNYYTTPSSYSLFYYDETVTGNVEQGYIGYPLSGRSTTNSAIVVGKGYTTFIRQCTVPTVIDVTGPINQGNITLPVTYTSTGNATADGWNLVGNPYPCTIDWDAGTWTKTRIASAISITDNGSGMTRYYDRGITNDIPNGQISTGQAFFVRATGANPSLIVRENTKVSNVVEFFREEFQSVPSFALKFSDGLLEDRLYVKIQDGASEMLDDFDAPKIKNQSAFNFSVLSADQRKMAISAVAEIAKTKEFELSMDDAAMGTYNIALELREEHFTDRRFILLDQYLNTRTALRPSEAYTFSITQDPASASSDRFRLIVYRNESAEDEALAGVMIYPNPVKDICAIEILQDDVERLEFINAQGQQQTSVIVDGQMKIFNIDLSSYARGIYLVTVVKRNSKKSIRLFKE